MHQYTNGEWDKLPSTLDEAKDIKELYQRLDNLGFSTHQSLIYRGGNAQLYLRQSTPGKRTPPIAFDFCCVLYLGNGSNQVAYPIALKKLEDVLAFLREIDAHPKGP